MSKFISIVISTKDNYAVQWALYAEAGYNRIIMIVFQTADFDIARERARVTLET